ncbi:MAG: protein kinase [Planctomycetota bacterium]|nr:protein kinase [Planctomycetota bacterium]
MAGSVSDEAFARLGQQMGVVTFDDVEAARATQAEGARQGIVTSLPDVLLQQGVITPKQRETIEKRILAEQQGGLQQLGLYKLLKKLGHGGMGTVYLADDTAVGRKVAIKVLAKKYSEDRELLTRFRREAQATGKLNHVNIVMAYMVAEEAGTHYYAMEYCDGEILDRILKHCMLLPWDTAVKVVMQVARGLKHAHDHGIIHRDIKPANVFICKPLGTPENTQVETFAEGFVAKILDLGLSKNVSGQDQSFYTQTGVAMGTPHYISPEQAKGEKSIDGRADIYSLGATFYHLITGRTPFQGTTAAIVMMKHLSEQLPNPQDIVPEVPEGVVQVIMKMMAKEPGDRYANCKELLGDLELILDGRMPGSQAVDVGKSSVAMAQRVVANAGTRGLGDGGKRFATRRHAPVPERRADDLVATAELVPIEEVTGDEGAGSRQPVLLAELREAGAPQDEPQSGRMRYIAAGVLALGALTFVAVLVFRDQGEAGAGKSEIRDSKSETSTGLETAKPETPTPIPDTRPAAVQPGTADRKPETGLATEKGVTDAWIKMVQGLPAEKQVEAVKKKLEEMNPAVYKVQATPKIEGGKVTGLALSGLQITDITPVRVLKDLKTFSCVETRVNDLSPLSELSLTALDVSKTQVNDLAALKDMPLTRLKCTDTKVSSIAPLAGKQIRELGLRRTAVSDLSVLKGMPLVSLDCNGAPVLDIRPLEGMSFAALNLYNTKITDLAPLAGATISYELYIDRPESHLDALRKVKLLKAINDISVAEFWKKYPETEKSENRNAEPGSRPLDVGQKDKDGWTCIFNGRDLTGWQVCIPLNAEDGAIAFKGSGDIVRNMPLYYELKARLRMDGGTACVKLWKTRAHGEYTAVYLKANGEVKVGGNSTGGKLKPGTWQDVLLRVTGAAISLDVDGQSAASATETAREAAAINFYPYQGGDFHLKDLWLRELGPDGKPLGATPKP